MDEAEKAVLAYVRSIKRTAKRTSMRRREFVTAAATVGTAGLTGCMDGGDGNRTDGNGTDGNGTADGDGAPEVRVTDTTFTASRDATGPNASASYSFGEGTLRVTGTIVGSDACKTAELGGARYDEDRGAVVVDVATTDAENAGDVCAQVLTPVAYEATVDVEYDEQPSVVVTHDGEEVDAREAETDGNGGWSSTEMTGTGFEVVGTECGESKNEAEYTATQAMSEDDESTGVVEGTVSGPDSCTTAELGYASYDADEDTLIADVRTASTDKDACQDCVTEVDYRLEANFKNGVPDSAAVSHDGVVVDGVGDGIETAEFTVEAREGASGDEGSGNAEFNEDEGSITLTGTVIGNNGCATARLAEARVEEGVLNANVETVNDGGEVCTQALVALGYEATLSFDGEIPNEVSVSHDGTGVMSGAYASQSVSAEPGNGSG